MGWNLFKHMYIHVPISTHTECTAASQMGVVDSESKYVECGPAECNIASRSALLWVSERKRAADVRSPCLSPLRHCRPPLPRRKGPELEWRD